MPDYKKPDQQLWWEKENWWQNQVKDKDYIPHDVHPRRGIRLHHLLNPSSYWNKRDGKPMFPWTEAHDLTDNMPIQTHDEHKEWNRYKIYHSMHWGSEDMIEKRRLNAERVEKIDAELAEFAELRKTLDDSKIIEATDEAMFSIVNLIEDAEQLAEKNAKNAEASLSSATGDYEDELDKLYNEEVKYWGKEETADELLDRYNSYKTDFNIDFMYQVWNPKSKKESEHIWTLTNMRILHGNFEGAVGSWEARHNDSKHFKIHDKEMVKEKIQEIRDKFEPYKRRQKELKIMMNKIYRSKGLKAPYVIN